MIDVVIKDMIRDNLAELNTTMQCTVVGLDPLTIKPIPKKPYLAGEEEYPLIVNPLKLKEWTLTLGDVTPNSDFVTDDTTFSGGMPLAFSYPLFIGDVVLVAFGKKDLTDAVILGVIDG